MTPLLSWLQQVSTLDLRAVAAFRVALAVSLVVDVGLRLRDYAAHYTDAGILPLAYVRPQAGEWSWLLTWPSLTAPTFALVAAAAVALGLRWRPRVAAAVALVALHAVHVRNPLVLNGGDQLLRLLLLWSVFLPTEERGRVCSLGSFALVVQVCLVYLVTMTFRTGPAWWDGTAVSMVLANPMLTLTGGELLGGWPALHAPLTWWTVVWETVGIALVWSPWAHRRCRAVAIAGFVLLHVGLGLTLTLGLFPLVSVVSWIPLLPLAPDDEPLAPRLPTPVRALVGVALAAVLGWNARTLGWVQWPRVLNAPVRAVMLDQTWNLFAPEPRRVVGVYRLERGDGTAIWPDGAPNRRWGKAMRRLEKPENRHLRGPFARHLLAGSDDVLRWSFVPTKTFSPRLSTDARVLWEGDRHAPDPERASANPMERMLERARVP